MAAAATALRRRNPCLIYTLTHVGAARYGLPRQSLIAARCRRNEHTAQAAIIPKGEKALDTFMASPTVSTNKVPDRIQQKSGDENSDIGLKISDMFLEIGSNVGSAARRDELGVAESAIGRSALRP